MRKKGVWIIVWQLLTRQLGSIMWREVDDLFWKHPKKSLMPEEKAPIVLTIDRGQITDQVGEARSHPQSCIDRKIDRVGS